MNSKSNKPLLAANPPRIKSTLHQSPIAHTNPFFLSQSPSSSFSALCKNHQQKFPLSILSLRLCSSPLPAEPKAQSTASPGCNNEPRLTHATTGVFPGFPITVLLKFRQHSSSSVLLSLRKSCSSSLL